MNQNCLILNYHSITDVAAGPTHFDPLYSISSDRLKAHLDLFQSLNVKLVNLDQLTDLKSSERPSICLSFDDGHSSDHEVVSALLDEYGIKASFFPTLMNFHENDGRWKEYRELAAAGHIIGAHGVSHRYLSNLKDEEQYQELKLSKSFIQQQIGGAVNYFSLPGGKYNQTTLRLAKKAGFKKVLSTEFEFLDPSNLPFSIGRWSLTKNISIETLERVLSNDPSTIRKIRSTKNVKRRIANLLGNKLTDRINYLINQ